ARTVTSRPSPTPMNLRPWGSAGTSIVMLDGAGSVSQWKALAWIVNGLRFGLANTKGRLAVDSPGSRLSPGTWPVRSKSGRPSGNVRPSALETVTVGSLIFSTTKINGVAMEVSEMLLARTLTVDWRVRGSWKIPE